MTQTVTSIFSQNSNAPLAEDLAMEQRRRTEMIRQQNAKLEKELSTLRVVNNQNEQKVARQKVRIEHDATRIEALEKRVNQLVVQIKSQSDTKADLELEVGNLLRSNKELLVRVKKAMNHKAVLKQQNQTQANELKDSQLQIQRLQDEILALETERKITEIAVELFERVSEQFSVWMKQLKKTKFKKHA